MAPPDNAQETLQAMGRVVRLGQKETPVIIILALDGTYDDRLLARSERKMMNLIYSNRESEKFTKEKALEVIKGHETCYLGNGSLQDRANRLINERIYQLTVGTNRPYIYHYNIDLSEVHKKLKQCGHPYQYASMSTFGIDTPLPVDYDSNLSNENVKKADEDSGDEQKAIGVGHKRTRSKSGGTATAAEPKAKKVQNKRGGKK
jgi:hypothetical protein